MVCAADDCTTRHRNPFCEIHMAKLDLMLRNRVMSAFLKLQAGRGADALRIYSNMLELGRKKLEEQKETQGVLL